MRLQLLHATANRPGAIAILQLMGDSSAALRDLTGESGWPVGKLRLVKFADIDDGLAVRMSEQIAQLMPHGGMRVVQRITARLIDLGATVVHDTTSLEILDEYPEAIDQWDGLALRALARAQSPLAVDLLLDQPRRWREFIQAGEAINEADRDRSRRLNRLIHPPIVVLAGRPNVGKSTLSNVLLGRSMSIAYDMPGTTRDYTAGRINLAGLVVDWHDTPGIRTTHDPIERKAIGLANRLIARADLLIAMADPANDWPDLPRKPDIFVSNKTDLDPMHNCGTDVRRISATTGDGIAEFVLTIRNRLVSQDDFNSRRPWLFDDGLLKMKK